MGIESTIIGAVVLAAGQSKRMGKPKMVLPWGNTTVIGHVIDVLHSAGIDPVIVVTGGAENQVRVEANQKGACVTHNPDFETRDMLTSLQTGLRVMPGDVEAALVCLGDQPQIEVEVIDKIQERYVNTHGSLIVPSFHMRRGHPWLVGRLLWDEILGMDESQSMRDFLNHQVDVIDYVVVESGSILKDLDTPSDYEEERPHGDTP